MSSKKNAYRKILKLEKLLAECQAQVSSVANKNGFLRKQQSERLKLQVKTLLTYFGWNIFDNLGPPLWEFFIAEG